MSGEGIDGDDGDENKQEYEKKEFVARPYECTSGMDADVE
jgi:WD40 repeat protein